MVNHCIIHYTWNLGVCWFQAAYISLGVENSRLMGDKIGDGRSGWLLPDKLFLPTAFYMSCSTMGGIGPLSECRQSILQEAAQCKATPTGVLEPDYLKLVHIAEQNGTTKVLRNFCGPILGKGRLENRDDPISCRSSHAASSKILGFRKHQKYAVYLYSPQSGLKLVVAHKPRTRT